MILAITLILFTILSECDSTITTIFAQDFSKQPPKYDVVSPSISIDFSNFENVIGHIFPKPDSVSSTVISSKDAVLNIQTNSSDIVESALKILFHTRVIASMRIDSCSKNLLQRLQGTLSTRKIPFNVTLHCNDTGQFWSESFTFKSSRVWREVEVNYVPLPPGISIDKYGKTSGFDIEILQLIKQYLKNKVKIKVRILFRFDRSLEEVYGLNGSSNFAVGPFTFFQVDFAKGLDFSKLLLPLTVYFMYKKPGPINKIFTMTYPFSGIVWLAIAISILLMLTYLALFQNLYQRSSMFHIFSISLIALLIESMPHHHLNIRRIHDKTYFSLFLWLSATCLLSTAYRSTLLASLVSVEYERPLETFQDLVDNNVGITYLRGTPQLDRMFEQAESPAIRQLYKNLIDKNLFLNSYPPSEEEINSMLKGELSQVTSQTHIVGQRHQFVKSREYIPPTLFSGYIYKIKFPYREDIERLLGRILDMGIYQAFYDRSIWSIARPERDHARTSSTDDKARISALDMGHLTPLWISMAVLFALSLLTFVVEVFVKRSHDVLDGKNEAWK